jgi:hypothetical protein
LIGNMRADGSLKQLHRSADAWKFSKAAAASSVPHLGWESNFQAGIQDAQTQLQAPISSPGLLRIFHEDVESRSRGPIGDFYFLFSALGIADRVLLEKRRA